MGEASKFGSRVKRLRERKGWTQQQLADRSGVNRVTIANLERGRRAAVSLNNGARLAAAFGISLDVLILVDVLDDDAELVAPSA